MRRNTTLIVTALVALVIGLGAGIGLGFAFDSDEVRTVATPAITPSPSQPANLLSASLTKQRRLNLPQQEFFATDGSPLTLRLEVRYDGNGFNDGMADKAVTVVSTGRTDHTSGMKLGSVVLYRVSSSQYFGSTDLMLPPGTYAFQFDGKDIPNATLRVTATKAR
jgi:hypothetical protein